MRWLGAITVLILTAIPTSAQEALRISSAGAEAAEARRKATEHAYYNLKYGPASFRFSSGLGIEGNDNVNLSEDDAQADLIARPHFNFDATWVVTPRNALHFSANIGYAKYLTHTELDHLFVTPGSDLSFDVFVGDAVVNFHDRYSLLQEAYNQPSVSGTGNFGRFQNVGGVAVNWDLNQLVLSFGYDHETYISTTSAFDYLDHGSELVFARVGFAPSRTTLFGLEAGAGFTSYNRNSSTKVITIDTNGVPVATNSFRLNDIAHFGIGPFFRSQVSEHMSIKLSAGYTAYFPQGHSPTSPARNTSAVYGDLTIQHVINAKLAYTMSAGRQIQLGIYSSTLDLSYARLIPDWRIIRNVTFRTPIFFEHAEETRPTNEKINRFGAGIELSRALTKKLSATARYNFLTSDSNLAQRDYRQNRLVLDLSYRF